MIAERAAGHADPISKSERTALNTTQREKYLKDSKYRERRNTRSWELTGKINRERYRTDPAHRERCKAQNRERYRTDPAHRERCKAQNRERYRTDPAHRERCNVTSWVLRQRNKRPPGYLFQDRVAGRRRSPQNPDRRTLRGLPRLSSHRP